MALSRAKRVHDDIVGGGQFAHHRQHCNHPGHVISVLAPASDAATFEIVQEAIADGRRSLLRIMVPADHGHSANRRVFLR
jgi:hypothetical protein